MICRTQDTLTNKNKKPNIKPILLYYIAKNTKEPDNLEHKIYIHLILFNFPKI